MTVNHYVIVYLSDFNTLVKDISNILMKTLQDTEALDRGKCINSRINNPAVSGITKLLTPAGFSIRSQHSVSPGRCREYANSPAYGEIMKKIPITKAGFEKLKKELEYVKTVSMPENIRDIEVARAHGDITENAEYQAAKERQSFLQGRIQELENNLATSYIVSLEGLTKDKVVFGSTVTLEDIKTGNGITYQLVGPFESDLNENKISVTSPIGKALIGKSVGDEVIVNAPGGTREFEVVDINIIITK